MSKKTNTAANQPNKTQTASQTRHRIESTELVPNEATRIGVFVFALVLFALGFAVVFLATFWILSPVTIIISLIAGLLLASSVRIAPQWERVAILRLGKFHRVAGPGLYGVIPFFEYAAIHVDQRTMTSAFSAEAALTADLVPVDVDAILFWMVWDAERACLEVKNYPKAVLRSAQTALRDALGQTNLEDLSIRRQQLDHELEGRLAEKCQDWGITVLSVEIRDIRVPDELQNALSKEAQATRERDARLIIAEVEKDVSELFVEAANIYETNPIALKLRAMNLAYESAKDGKGVLLFPSALSEGLDIKEFFKNQ